MNISALMDSSPRPLRLVGAGATVQMPRCKLVRGKINLSVISAFDSGYKSDLAAEQGP